MNLSVYGIALLLGGIGAIIGLLRGACRQTVRFITVIVSAVLSFLACLAIFPAIIDYLDGMSMQDVVNMVGAGLEEPIQKIILSIESSLIGDVLTLPLAFLVMPLVFVILFVLISFIFLLVHKAVSGALGFSRRRNNALTRMGGAALGFFQGVIVTAILLIPLSGTLSTAEFSIAKACEAYPTANNALELEDSFNKNFGSMVKNPVMQLSAGMSSVTYNAWSKVKVDGDEIDVRETVDTAVDMIVLLGEISDCDFNSFTPEQKEVVRALTSDAYGNRYLAILFSGFLRSFAAMIDDGAIAITFEDPVGGFVEHFIAIFATSNKENLDDDVRTLENVIFIVSDDGAIKTMKEAPEKMFEKFTAIGADGHTLLGRIQLELEKNRRQPLGRNRRYAL